MEQVLFLDPEKELHFKVSIRSKPVAAVDESCIARQDFAPDDKSPSSVVCGPYTEVSTSEISLTNTTEALVCFKIKTTAMRRYCAHPNYGVIGPFKTVVVSIMLQPMNRETIGADNNRHRVMVQSMFAPKRDVNIKTVWKDALPGDLMFSKLRCIFDPPFEDLMVYSDSELDDMEMRTVSPTYSMFTVQGSEESIDTEPKREDESNSEAECSGEQGKTYRIFSPKPFARTHSTLGSSSDKQSPMESFDTRRKDDSMSEAQCSEEQGETYHIFSPKRLGPTRSSIGRSCEKRSPMESFDTKRKDDSTSEAQCSGEQGKTYRIFSPKPRAVFRTPGSSSDEDAACIQFEVKKLVKCNRKLKEELDIMSRENSRLQVDEERLREELNQSNFEVQEVRNIIEKEKEKRGTLLHNPCFLVFCAAMIFLFGFVSSCRLM